MIYKIATTAANWWIEEMKKQCCKMYPERIQATGTGFVILDNSFAEELSRFKTILTDEIYSCISTQHYLCLTCSHKPSHPLIDIAKKAKISITYFPRQKEMHVSTKSVLISIDSFGLKELPILADTL